MTKIIPVILVALFSVACAGEPFTGDEFSPIAVAGEAGDSGVDAAGTTGAGSSSAARGGAMSVGGSTVAGAGKGTGGSPVGGSGGAGGVGGSGVGGSPVNVCEFDAAALTAQLPDAASWQTFTMNSGSVCAGCAYEPCGKFAVSWGKPTVNGKSITYSPTYTSNATVPTQVHAAKDDGQCAPGVLCEVKPQDISVSFSVARKGDAWQITDVVANVTFVDDECTAVYGDPGELTAPMAADLQQEIQDSLVGLKFPCK